MIDFGTQVLLLTIVGGIATVLAVESIRPLRVVGAAPFWRWLNNLALATLDFAVLVGVGPWLSLLAASLLSSGSAGLLARLELGPLASFLVLFLSLQFVAYWLHRAMHGIPVLWRIHAVHHADTEVDATTAFRHHPLEVILSAAATLPVLVLLLPDPMLLLAYNVLYALVAIIHHGNLTLGPRLDGWLRPFVVTPDFHRLHHTAERPYTDRNYATILPLLDHLFRTAAYLPAEQQKSLRMGLEYFREPRDARLDQMLLIPFRSSFGRAAGHQAATAR